MGNKKASELSKTCAPIMNKAKPPPPKPKEEEKKEGDAAADQKANDNDEPPKAEDADGNTVEDKPAEAAADAPTGMDMD